MTEYVKEIELAGISVRITQGALASAVGRGGDLFLWAVRARCCGRPGRLVVAHERPEGREFALEWSESGFRLHLQSNLGRLPETIDIDSRGRSGRIEAYWDGCAWIT
jgi:hypothetical protein